MYRKVLRALIALGIVGVFSGFLFAKPAFAYSDAYYSPDLYGSWTGFTDLNGVPSAYANSNGSNNTAEASWWISVPQSDCQLWIYVPEGHATATVGYGLYHAFLGGQLREAVWSTDQNNDYGWTRLGGTLPTDVDEIDMANSDGQTNTQVGVGTSGTSLEVYCP
jgi:hypothetical protein